MAAESLVYAKPDCLCINLRSQMIHLLLFRETTHRALAPIENDAKGAAALNRLKIEDRFYLHFEQIYEARCTTCSPIYCFKAARIRPSPADYAVHRSAAATPHASSDCVTRS
eukprot:6202791-Pleurochrysis_carterae.AAC.1